MNNSTDDDRCYWYKSAGQIADIIYSHAQMPILCIFGLIGQSLLLIAFYKQTRQEKAYWYQFLLTVSEIGVIISRVFYVITIYWLSGVQDLGANWFMSCFGCMWITAHFAFPIENMLETTSLFLAIAICADRIF